MAIPGLPAPLDGLRIVQLTDLHMAPCFRPAFFERVIDACRGWEADLVVLTGDIVDDDAAIAWIEPCSRRWRPGWGSSRSSAITTRTTSRRRSSRSWPAPDSRPWRVAGRPSTPDGATIAVGGTSAPWGPDVDPAAMPPADFRILLSHSPDRFYRAAEWGIDLMLSGHNHGGQIRLPSIGAVFMPSIYSRRFDRGFFRRGRTLMYASDGIAGMHPVRYGCPPEVTRFVLRPAPTSSESGCIRAHDDSTARRRPARQRVRSG